MEKSDLGCGYINVEYINLVVKTDPEKLRFKIVPDLLIPEEQVSMALNCETKIEGVILSLYHV